MKKFEIGKTYTMTSPCDRGCVWVYTVTSRTAATVTITDGTKTKRCRISTWNGEGEAVLPLGRYSMCPVLRAENEVA